MPQRDDGFKLMRAAWLIDGNGGPPLERVAMEGATLEEFSYEHQTVLPGLVDCHVHLIGTGDGRSGGDLATLPDEVLPEYAGSTRSGRWKGARRLTFWS